MARMQVGVKKYETSRMGAYQLLAKIGEGGMGTVYLAKMEGGLVGFNKLAVVKELRADLVGSSAFVEMFLDEARLAARLTHPNVVHTYEADSDNGRLYIAMEYLDGQPWSRVRHRLWANRTLPLAIHLRVLADALSGLHYAHELQDFGGAPLDVVHCDMSPQNVFVTYDGQVKVVDFGVARAALVSRQVSPDLFFGKLAYCAPEQARGEEVDRRADIFSVGVMLWEALTGRRFASGNDTTTIRRLRARGEEPRVREVAPTLPRVLSDICDRALATDPADRFATAAEFREQLAGYLSLHWKGADDLGALVSEAFAHERERVRNLVRRRLQGPGIDAIEDLVDSAVPDSDREHTLAADLSELASVTRERGIAGSAVGSEEITVPTITLAPELDAPPVKRPPWAQWKPALIGGALLALAGAGLLLAGGEDQDAAKEVAQDEPAGSAVPAPALARGAPRPAVPAASGSGAKAEAEAVRTVELVLSASPIEATLYLDGERLPSNPFVLRPAADSDEHRISARAPGYDEKELRLTFDQDRIVAMELRRAEPERASTRRSRRRLPASRERRGAPAAESPESAADRAPARQRDEVDFGTRLQSEGGGREIYDEVPF